MIIRDDYYVWSLCSIVMMMMKEEELYDYDDDKDISIDIFLTYSNIDYLYVLLSLLLIYKSFNVCCHVRFLSFGFGFQTCRIRIVYSNDETTTKTHCWMKDVNFYGIESNENNNINPGDYCNSAEWESSTTISHHFENPTLYIWLLTVVDFL